MKADANPPAASAADPSLNSGQDLRARAEAAIRANAPRVPPDLAALTPAATHALLHTLQVHQIELEMQNEDLRQAEADQDALRARYSELYDFVPVGYCTVSDQGLIQEANLTLATLLGVARSALIGKPFSRFIVSSDRDDFRRFSRRLPALGKPQSCELRMVKSDGAPFWGHVEATAGSAEGDATVCRIGLSEVTELKQAEATTQKHLAEAERSRAAMVSILEDQREAEVALRESEEKFACAFRDSPVAMAIRDLATDCYLDVNERCLAMTGYSREETIGHSPTEIGWMSPADCAGNRQSMTAPEGVTEREIRLRHKDGRTVIGSYTSRPLRIGGRNCLLSITQDITARKAAEAAREAAEAAREALTRAVERKNRELENLVYVTSHDLRSPMLNIQGFSQRIEGLCTELNRLLAAEPWSAADRAELATITTTALPKALTYVLTSVEKMDRLIGGLLRLSRVGRVGLKHGPLDLKAIWNEIVSTQAFSIQESGAVVEVGVLPGCWGDAGQVNQLFSNLFDNALKYRDPVRPMRVTVSGRVEGRRAVYCVADTGVGIAPQHRDKIWEVFFRANPGGPASGEGLGLNLVHRIVERHQGEIWLESTEGEGSRFFVALPLAAESDAVKEAKG